MVYVLSEEQSAQWLEGNWSAYHVEQDVEEDLDRQHGTEPVAVVLRDGSVAFYLMEKGVRIGSIPLLLPPSA
jgi:hypothetical protein